MFETLNQKIRQFKMNHPYVAFTVKVIWHALVVASATALSFKVAEFINVRRTPQ